MSDPIRDPENPAVPDDLPETEIIIGDEKPEEEPKAEVVTLTPEDFAALKAQADSAKAVREGIEGLAGRLTTPAAPAPANAPTQSAEEFFAEHSDDIFDKEKGPALLKKFTKMVGEQEYGPVLQGLSSSLATTRKELLEARDPHYKKYKSEVEALVASQPPNVRSQPDIYERAWAQVRAQHQAEIEKETIDAKVDEALKAKFKELGIDPEKPQGRPAAHVSGEGRSIPQVTTGPVRRQARVPDEKTLAEIKAWAMQKGYDLDTALERRGYLK